MSIGTRCCRSFISVSDRISHCGQKAPRGAIPPEAPGSRAAATNARRCGDRRHARCKGHLSNGESICATRPVGRRSGAPAGRPQVGRVFFPRPQKAISGPGGGARSAQRGAGTRVACEFNANSIPGQPNLRGPRRLSRSKPMETTHSGPFRPSRTVAPASFWCAIAGQGDGGPGRLRCKFGHGTGAITDAGHRRVGPRRGTRRRRHDPGPSGIGPAQGPRGPRPEYRRAGGGRGTAGRRAGGHERPPSARHRADLERRSVRSGGAGVGGADRRRPGQRRAGPDARGGRDPRPRHRAGHRLRADRRLHPRARVGDRRHGRHP